MDLSFSWPCRPSKTAAATRSPPRANVEPVLETRRPDARVIAGGEGLIVQFCVEVACVGVGGHLTCVLFGAQDSAGELVETERFGAGQLDSAIDRRPHGDGSQCGGDVISRDGLHEGW